MSGGNPVCKKCKLLQLGAVGEVRVCGRVVLVSVMEVRLLTEKSLLS